MPNDFIELKTTGLDKILKSLSGDIPTVRIGILGQKTVRSSSAKSATPSNAEIAAKHEFGLDGMPVRSILRIPLIDNMQKYLDRSTAFTKAVLKEVLMAGDLIPWLKKIGLVGEGIVADGFASGGFGKWKPSNMLYKKNHQTLVETQQLRNSITSDVVE